MFHLLDTNGEFVCMGEHSGDVITVPGKGCFAIQPLVKEIDDVMRFCFDKQFILDLNVGIAGQDNEQLLGRKTKSVEETNK